MNDTIEYIEAYFRKQLTDDENRRFEKRCVEDELFATEVARYVSLKEAIRQQLLEQKKQEWTSDRYSNKDTALLPVRTILRKWLPYVAAASLIITVSLYFVYNSGRPQQLASLYITEHFVQLSQTMDASGDSLQQGIEAYNNKNYRTALQLFNKVSRDHPGNSKAKKYTGLVYLVTKDYDKALQQFDELSSKGLYHNPGLFLKAVTLLKRNKQGDKAEAKKLLEQVVEQKAEGSREAEQWLKKL